MGTPFSDSAIRARRDALDVAAEAIEVLPGDQQSNLLSNMQIAHTMLDQRNVRAAHSVLRDVMSALDAANASNPALAAAIHKAHDSL